MCSIQGSAIVPPNAKDLHEWKEKEMSEVASKARQVGMARAFAVAFSVMVAVALLMTMAGVAEAATAPAAPVIVSPPEGSYDNDGAFTLSGTAPAYTTVHVRDASSGIYMGSAKVGSSVDWELGLSGLSEGKHAYKARVYRSTDLAFSAWSNIRTVTVDTKAPVAPSITSPTEGSRLVENVCSEYGFSGTAEPGSTVELFEGTFRQSTVQADLSGNWNMLVKMNSLRTYYFEARATDIAGNVSGWSDTRTIEVVPNFDTSEAAEPPDCSLD
jgi:hypothetical protein